MIIKTLKFIPTMIITILCSPFILQWQIQYSRCLKYLKSKSQELLNEKELKEFEQKLKEQEKLSAVSILIHKAEAMEKEGKKVDQEIWETLNRVSILTKSQEDQIICLNYYKEREC